MASNFRLYPFFRIYADDQLDRSLAGDRLLGRLATLLTITLAVIDLDGVMSFVVSRRTREIGIRLTIGAARGVTGSDPP